MMVRRASGVPVVRIVMRGVVGNWVHERVIGPGRIAGISGMLRYVGRRSG
jgi:hypothetical protein